MKDEYIITKSKTRILAIFNLSMETCTCEHGERFLYSEIMLWKNDFFS